MIGLRGKVGCAGDDAPPDTYARPSIYECHLPLLFRQESGVSAPHLHPSLSPSPIYHVTSSLHRFTYGGREGGYR